ncbi:MAG: hypothetical protein PSV35_03440 [bacterium]|nr:hypothetical protein [bacterium]
MNVLKKAGLITAVTMRHGVANQNKNLLELSRLEVHNSHINQAFHSLIYSQEKRDKHSYTLLL